MRRIKQLLAAAAVSTLALVGVGFAAPAGAFTENGPNIYVLAPGEEYGVLVNAAKYGPAAGAYISCIQLGYYSTTNAEVELEFQDCNWILGADWSYSDNIVVFWLHYKKSLDFHFDSIPNGYIGYTAF